MNLAPLAIQKFFDNNGRPLVGGKLFTYVAGTSTKQATYTSSSGAQQNTNPIILDYRGEARVWLDPSLSYKFVLADKDDTDPPARPIWSVDNIGEGVSLTQDAFDTLLEGSPPYLPTPAELAAGSIIVDLFKLPGNVLRYGLNTTPGSTDMSAAFAAAANQSVRSEVGAAVAYAPTGNYYAPSVGSISINTGFAFKGDASGKTVITTGKDGLYAITCGGSAFCQIKLTDFTLIPGTSDATGNGITINGGGAIPSLTMRDFVSLSAGSNTYRRVISGVNIGETSFDRVFLYGLGAASASLQGLHLETSGSPGSSATVQNFNGLSIYNFVYGIDCLNQTSPGIEGVSLGDGCTIVGCGTNVRYINAFGTGYFPPQFTVTGGHYNASVNNFEITGVTQLPISGATIYNSGNAEMFKLTDCNKLNVTGNIFQRVSGNCSVFTVTSTSGPQNFGVIADNQCDLGASTGYFLNLAAADYVNGFIKNNLRTGGAGTMNVLSGTLAGSMVLSGNTLDAADIQESLTTSATPTLIGKRAKLFNMSAPGVPTTVTFVTPRYDGDVFSLAASDANITLQHNANQVMLGGANLVMSPTKVATFVALPAGIIKQIS